MKENYIKIMDNNETKTYEVECLPKFLPLELNSEGIETLGNYHNSLVNSMYYSNTLNYSYYTFLVTT